MAGMEEEVCGRRRNTGAPNVGELSIGDSTQADKLHAGGARGAIVYFA
jgi:hypothetical protein